MFVTVFILSYGSTPPQPCCPLNSRKWRINASLMLRRLFATFRGRMLFVAGSSEGAWRANLAWYARAKQMKPRARWRASTVWAPDGTQNEMSFAGWPMGCSAASNHHRPAHTPYYALATKTMVRAHERMAATHEKPSVLALRIISNGYHQTYINQSTKIL